jgi:hypothetical protein
MTTPTPDATALVMQPAIAIAPPDKGVLERAADVADLAVEPPLQN